MKDLAIVYLVAGMSNRFKGKIKQFAIIGPQGETLIEYSMKQAIKAGFTKIIFIVGNKTQEPFEEKFGDSYQDIPISYALQSFDEAIRDRPWGTCDALCTAKQLIDCPFVVCNGDDIYGENTFKILAEHLRNNKEAITPGYKLGTVLPETGTANRGIFQLDSKGNIKTVIENLDINLSNISEKGLKPEDLCSMNIFGLHPETLQHLSEKLETFKQENQEDRKAECFLPNELTSLIKENKLTMKIFPATDKWFGITYPEDEAKVREELALIKN